MAYTAETPSEKSSATAAIGDPVMIDTAQEPPLSRLFSNRVITRYPAFEEFYGMEEAIEQIVSYLKHAA